MKTFQRIWRPLGLLSLVLWGANLGIDLAHAPHDIGALIIDVQMAFLMGAIMWTELKEIP